MDRRKFLTRATTATAGLMAAGTVPQQSYAKRSPNATINVAVVGIRGRGKSHYNGFAGLKNVRVTHVVEVDDTVFDTVVPQLDKRLAASKVASIARGIGREK